MRRFVTGLSLATVLVVSAAPVAPLASAGNVPPDAPDPDGEIRVIIELDVPFTPGAMGHQAHAERRGMREAQAAAAAALDKLPARIDRTYESLPFVAVSVASDELERIEELPQVLSVSPDLVLEPMLDSSLVAINATAPTFEGSALTGQGQAVAILDTGVAAGHPFFASLGGGTRVVAEACFASGEDQNPAVGDCPNGQPTQLGPGSAAPLRGESHGTHVAGIAAGAREGTNPARGVAPAADIIAVQTFSAFEAGLAALGSDLLASLSWVYDQRGSHDIASVNLSLGSGTYPGACDSEPGAAPFLAAIGNLRAAGIVTVAAAGNSGSRSAMAFPACLSSVVSVGATDNHCVVAPYSDLSQGTDLVAPGTSVRSSMVNGGYASHSGTSMASPHAAGALALLAEAAPDASANARTKALKTSSARVDDTRTGGVVSGLRPLDVSAALGVSGATGPSSFRCAPGSPSLSTEGASRRVTVSWKAVSHSSVPFTYRVYRSGSGSCSTSSTLRYQGSSTSFTDERLRDATTYSYCATATNAAGNASPLSAVRSVKTSPLRKGCHVLVGDWNASGRDGVGWYCDGDVRLRTANGQVYEYRYGRRGDVPIVADWDGNGMDTVSVIRDGTWHVNNRLAGGSSSRSFIYGRVSRGDLPIAGDWNRGRKDLPGIVRDRTWHLRARQSGGSADWSFVYGRLTAGDLPLWGDWNGDGRDTAGIVRSRTWHLRNKHAGGTADISYVYGRVTAGDIPVVGDWNKDGLDTPGIVRDDVWHLKHRHGGGVADQSITFHRP